MRFAAAILAGAVGFLASAAGVEAASLHVAPTSIDLVAPDSASVLSLKNDDQGAINVQIRVFRWRQVDGVEQLEPTRDVVASPPATTLKAGGATVVRIVRVSKGPVDGEESYRVIVDELPDPAKRRAGTVTLVLRYSIPVFFASPEASPSAVSWSVLQHDGGHYLVAANSGERRMRVSHLTVKDQGGARVSLGEGLAGYVLGDSTMLWPLVGGSTLSGRSITVTAMSEAGPIDAAAPRR